MQLENVPQFNDNEELFIPATSMEMYDSKNAKLANSDFNKIRRYRGDLKNEFYKRHINSKIVNYFFNFNGVPVIRDKWLYKHIKCHDIEIVYVLKGGNGNYYTRILDWNMVKSQIESDYRKRIINLKRNNLPPSLYKKYKTLYDEEKRKELRLSIWQYACKYYKENVFLCKRLYLSISSKIPCYMIGKKYDKVIAKTIESYFRYCSNVDNEEELIQARIQKYSNEDNSEYIEYLNTQTKQKYDEFMKKSMGDFS